MDVRHADAHIVPRSPEATRRAALAALTAGVAVAVGLASGILPEDARSETNRRIRRHKRGRNKSKSSSTEISIPGSAGTPGTPGTVIDNTDTTD
jgi:hypothetical protein